MMTSLFYTFAGHGYFDSTIFKDGFIVASDSKALKTDTFFKQLYPV
jgi:hypothetical protein